MDERIEKAKEGKEVEEDDLLGGQVCLAAAYKNWHFDMEGLPADLILRGVAIPDPPQPHGIKLLIKDYPCANDGFLICSAIENWVRKYVNHYYPTSTQVCQDREL